jgi:hypothetical protein
MPKLRELARPEMCPAACLHPNDAWRQLSEKRTDLGTLQLLAQCDLTSRIEPVDLKTSFAKSIPTWVMFIVDAPAG